MPDSPAQRLISLNRQAVAILRLGIPLDLGLGRDAEEQLLEINDRLIAETGRELSVEAWLQQQTLPERYREFAKVLLLCDDPAPVFESIAAQDLEREAAVNPIRQAFAEPLVVAILAYFGMILLCSFTVPHIQSQYVQEGREPVGLTRLLIELRNLMPYWIIAFPMLALGSWWLWRKLSKGKSLDRFPGGSAYTRWLAAESQTRQLAALVGSGINDDTALSLAGSSVDPSLGIRPIAKAIVEKGDPQSRQRALGQLARFYHFLAEDRRQTYFSKTPAFLGLLGAGVIVLCYGLATFLPWIEILFNLTELGEGNR